MKNKNGLKPTEENSEVSFEKVNENTGKVIVKRNGQTYTIELYSLSDKAISEIRSIREEMDAERRSVQI